MPKLCFFCDRLLQKKVNETTHDWKKRKFCNKKCANTHIAHQKYGNPLTRKQKRCADCKQILSLVSFSLNRSLPDKHQTVCKMCCNNRDYLRRGWNTKSKQEAFIKQQGKCEICDRKMIDWQKSNGDHNHKTGKARGLLCRSCNSALHMIENSILLKKALAYCKKYEKKLAKKRN